MARSLCWFGINVIVCVSSVCGFLNTESTSYYGCYLSPDALSSSNLLQWSGFKTTIEECLSECRTRGNILGAMKYSQCYCGYGDVHLEPVFTDCYDENAFRCPGNTQQICGGSYAVSVYTACEPGYGGRYCNVSCSFDCGKRVCQVNSRDTTGCMGICHSGWENLDNECSDACPSGYYGPKCLKSCPDGCANSRCNPRNGKCTQGCLNGLLKGPYCLSTCLTGTFEPNCDMCPPNCRDGGCDGEGVCSNGCETGWTGDRCNDACPAQYYGNGCQSRCPESCRDRLCDAETGKCDQCAAGYYGENCQSCSTKCFKKGCDDQNGRCNACNAGLQGDKCNQDCPQRCPLTCNQNGQCDSCGPGYYGNDCEPCKENCDGPCDPSSGKCSKCKSGNHGDYCTDECPKNCDGACVQSSGDCVKCKGGFYYQQCDVSCPVACVGACDQESGVCDCTAGYYGEKCEDRCPANCATPPCHKSTGHCISGCKETFYGPKCEQKCPCGDQCDENGNCPQTTERSEGVGDERNGGGSGGIIGGVVGGILLLAVVVAVIVFSVIRYRRRSANNNNTEQPEVDPSPPRHAVPESADVVYDTIDDSKVSPAESGAAADATYYNTQGGKAVPERAEPGPADEAEYYNTKGSKANSAPHAFRTNVASIVSHIQKTKQRGGGFRGEFKKIPEGLQAECTIAVQKKLTAKNRFKKIVPYDHNRVVLHDESVQDGYINASHISGFQLQHNYIAAQGPTSVSLYDFLCMIVEQRVETIVMVTDLFEDGSTKCQQYWPGHGDDDLVADDITVTLIQQHSTPNYVIRKLQIKKAGMTRSVQQYHYLDWPDHGAPGSYAPLLRLRELVLQHTQSSSVSNLVHGSAGVGRTGTFIALDILLRQAKVEPAVNVPATVKRLRQDRVNMVETQAQYEFLYQCLAEGIALGTLETDAATTQSDMSQQYQSLQLENMRPTM